MAPGLGWAGAWRPGAWEHGAVAARPFLPGTAPVSAHGLACLAPRSARGEAAGRLGTSVPRQPPGQNVDSALERRKEPRFSCSVPKPLQPLSFLCTQLPKPPFSSLTIPHSSPSSSAFPLASTIRLSFSCLGSCQLLAACSFLLPPFSFLTLLPVLSLTFYVFFPLFLPYFCRLAPPFFPLALLSLGE